MTMSLADQPNQSTFAGPRLVIERWRAGGTVVVAARPEVPGSLEEASPAILQLIEEHLPTHGGVLLRGFHGVDSNGFHAFARALTGELLAYDFASTPRTKIDDGLYTSTEYPRDQWIPQHNEQSYTTSWPMKIWFYCDKAADRGGETPVTDSRAIYRRINPDIRARFSRHGLLYVRNYTEGLDLRWQDVFRTSEKDRVEALCRQRGVDCEWFGDGALRTRQLCQSEAIHPKTGEPVWFNQAHLFHVSALHPDVREALLEIVPKEELPRNVYYGDGQPIENSALDEIRAQFDAEMLRFAWQAGDVLLLDNMLMAHGRAPFEGQRRVLVAMGQPHSSPFRELPKQF
jgi:alpha-ketoglutarate-dependent taurine dioxygenase